MNKRWFVSAAMTVMAAVLSPLAANATSTRTPECPPDDKLIGRLQVSSVDAPGTIWNLSRSGLAAAGFDVDDDQVVVDILNGWLGTDFAAAELQDAIDAFIDTARPWDANGNGYVCIFSVRGTRAYLGDPLYQFYTFGISDDRQPR